MSSHDYLRSKFRRNESDGHNISIPAIQMVQPAPPAIQQQPQLQIQQQGLPQRQQNPIIIEPPKERRSRSRRGI